jgi:hypothetical protein
MSLRVAATGMLLAGLLLADGGAVEFRKLSGPLLITVFGAPSPLHAGIADLSVMVEDERDRRAVLDAEVGLRISRRGEAPIVVPATRAQASNKLLYAAHPELPNAGEWRLNVQVNLHGQPAEAEGTITVLPRQAAVRTYWFYLAIVPAGVVLFVFLNRWLKWRQTGRL